MADLKEHRKEYRQQLFKQPTFWVGIILVAVGGILRYTNIISSLTFTVIFIVGFVLMISSKYRILGRLEQKYSNK